MLPSWDVFHVLLLHFPVACFVFAPLALILELIKPIWRSQLLILTLALLAVGTIFTYLVVASGEAAAELVDPPPEVRAKWDENYRHPYGLRMMTPDLKAALDEHQEGGENVRNLYTAITLLLAAVMFGPQLLKKAVSPKLVMSVHIVILLLCLGGAILLTDVAHEGGRLVHVFGVHARLEPLRLPVDSGH